MLYRSWILELASGYRTVGWKPCDLWNEIPWRLRALYLENHLSWQISPRLRLRAVR